MKEWMGKLRSLLVLGSIVLVLSACGRDNLTALVAKGYGADISMKLIILTTAVMTFVFIVAMIVMVIVLLRYRKKKGDRVLYTGQVQGKKMLETVCTISPIILVVIMAVLTMFATFQLAESKDAADHINIDVTGKQYLGHFDYQNEEISTSQDIYVPANKKVYLHLNSNDVIHSVWVASITGKVDVNTEHENTVYIAAYEE